MDLSTLIAGPASAGPAAPAARPGLASAAAGSGPAGTCADADLASGDGFASLVDLALAQLAGGVEADAAARGERGPTDDREEADGADAAADASADPIDAQPDPLAVSVLIAMAAPAAPLPVPLPATLPICLDGGQPIAIEGDRTAPMPAHALVEGPAVPAPVAPGAVAVAIAPVAAEGEAAGAPVGAVGELPVVAPATPSADRTPAQSTTMLEHPAPGALAAAAPATAAAPADTPAVAPPATLAAAAPATQAPSVTRTGGPAADQNVAPAGRRGMPAIAAAAPDAAPRPAGQGTPAFGDAAADASADRRSAEPTLKPVSAGVAVTRPLEAIGPVPAEASTPPPIAMVSSIALPAEGALRVLDTPGAARFGQTVASVDPDTWNLQAMVRSVRLFASGSGVHEARLQLAPEHLGPVALTVRVEQGSVTAHFRAETPAAQRWIETHQQELRAGLRDQGLEMRQVVVTTDPDGRREDRPDAPPKRQTRARRAPDADAPRFEVVV